MQRSRKTVTSATRWRVDCYQFEDKFPSTGGNSTSAKRVIVDEEFTQGRITSVYFSRSKASTAGEATFNVVGVTPDCLFQGNWVIIRSKVGDFSKNNSSPANLISTFSSKISADVPEGMPRFIGQIYAVDNTWSTDGTGNLTQTATVRVREWSSILFTPVRFDPIVASSIVNNASAQLSRVATLTVGKKADFSDYQKVATAAFSPFSMVKLVLAFIGALPKETNSLASNLSSAATSLAVSQGVSIEAAIETASKFANLVSKIPFLPKELLTDLGFKNCDPTNIFGGNESFATLASGVIKNPSTVKSGNYSDPKAFDGIYNEVSQLTDTYADPGDRPSTINIGPEFAAGFAAWNLIQQKSDPATSECFTDMIYIGTKNQGLARPVIYHRDQPFALKRFLKASEPVSKWTAYDDLPRMWIDSAYIQSFSLSNTFNTSPNILKVEPTAGGALNNAYIINSAYADSLTVLRAEQERFGGMESSISTEYMYFSDTVADDKELKTKVAANQWMKDVSLLNYLWRGLNYRFGQAQLSLKDNSLPVSVGQNVSFKAGAVTFCGHVESYSCSFNVNGDGSKTTNSSMSLSHVVKVEKDGSLNLLDAESFNNLTRQGESTKSLLETGLANQLSSGKSTVQGIIDGFKKGKK